MKCYCAIQQCILLTTMADQSATTKHEKITLLVNWEFFLYKIIILLWI